MEPQNLSESGVKRHCADSPVDCLTHDVKRACNQSAIDSRHKHVERQKKIWTD